MKKYRGFEEVQRMRDEKIKTLYPSRWKENSGFYYLYYPYSEPLYIQPGQSKTIQSGLKIRMLPDEILATYSLYGRLIDWIDGTQYNRPNDDGELSIVVKNDSDSVKIINYKDKYAKVKFEKVLLADYDVVTSNFKRKDNRVENSK